MTCQIFKHTTSNITCFVNQQGARSCRVQGREGSTSDSKGGEVGSGPFVKLVMMVFGYKNETKEHKAGIGKALCALDLASKARGGAGLACSPVKSVRAAPREVVCSSWDDDVEKRPLGNSEIVMAWCALSVPNKQDVECPSRINRTTSNPHNLAHSQVHISPAASSRLQSRASQPPPSPPSALAPFVQAYACLRFSHRGRCEESTPSHHCQERSAQDQCGGGASSISFPLLLPWHHVQTRACRQHFSLGPSVRICMERAGEWKRRGQDMKYVTNRRICRENKTLEAQTSISPMIHSHCHSPLFL